MAAVISEKEKVGKLGMCLQDTLSPLRAALTQCSCFCEVSLLPSFFLPLMHPPPAPFSFIIYPVPALSPSPSVHDCIACGSEFHSGVWLTKYVAHAGPGAVVVWRHDGHRAAGPDPPAGGPQQRGGRLQSATESEEQVAGVSRWPRMCTLSPPLRLHPQRSVLQPGLALLFQPTGFSLRAPLTMKI